MEQGQVTWRGFGPSCLGKSGSTGSAGMDPGRTRKGRKRNFCLEIHQQGFMSVTGHNRHPQCLRGLQKQPREMPLPLNLKMWYQSHTSTSGMYSPRSHLMNYWSRNNGIMPSTLFQDPSRSVQRSTQYPLSNRKNSMTSSTKTYQAAASVPQNCQWHPRSSSSRRRMGNYGSSRITESLTR